MNRTLALLLALATASIPALAQDNNRPNGQSGDRQSRRSENRRPEGQGGPGGPVNNEGGRPRMASPLIETLDANHDGIIDASEIQNASAALMRLDKNGDGKLTVYELRTRRPEGGRGFGGPSNQGRSGNPQEGRQGNRSEGRPQRPQFE